MNNFNNKYIERMLTVALLPLISTDFYYEDPYNDLGSDDSYSEILSKIYSLINKKCDIYNLDELHMGFEKFYPRCLRRSLKKKEKDIEEYYIEILTKLSETFISHRDGKLTFKYWKTEKNEFFCAYSGYNKLQLWNLMNRIIPVDILGVLYFLNNQKSDERYLEGFYSRISLPEKQLEIILEKGIAETHLHASASKNFYTSWKNLMNLFLRNNDSCLVNNKIINRDKTLGKYQKNAAIQRLLLASFLESNTNKKYSEYLKKLMYKENTKAIKDFFIGKGRSFDFLEKSLFFTEKGVESFEESELIKIFETVTELILGFHSVDDDQLKSMGNNQEDILDRLYFSRSEKKQINTYTENIFLMRCIKYLRENSKDKLFKKHFFGYIRVKNSVFNILTQGNSIKGLDNFINFFTPSTKVGKNIINSWSERLKVLFMDKNIKKAEIRISPANEKNENRIKKHMKKELVKILEAFKAFIIKTEEDIPDLGIIYHFIKKEDREENLKCVHRKEHEIHSDYTVSYEMNKRLYQMQANVIMELRSSIKGLSKYIVGIDAASREMAAEPWVFTPIFERIRNSSNTYFSIENKEKLKTLGFTYHVGEDFRHILTGLRNIDESIENFKFHSGDRIGHGIALGIKVDEWVKNHPIIIMPRREYMENLLWVWGTCKSSSVLLDIGYLERQILQLAFEIYKNSNISVYSLWKAYISKFKELKYDEASHFCPLTNGIEVTCGKCYIKSPLSKDDRTTLNIIYSYHCKGYNEKMEEPIYVENTKEKMAFIKEMQKILQKKIENRGIIIETNPSSNVVIGEMEGIFNHHILNLNNKEYESKVSIMCSINTDDPSVFNSTLSDEFAYIYYSLVNAGYSKEVVLQWIDKVRECGMTSSFIKSSKLSKSERIEELERIIRDLKN